jgi:hypothetical protein
LRFVYSLDLHFPQTRNLTRLLHSRTHQRLLSSPRPSSRLSHEQSTPLYKNARITRFFRRGPLSRIFLARFLSLLSRNSRPISPSSSRCRTPQGSYSRIARKRRTESIEQTRWKRSRPKMYFGKDFLPLRW